MSRFSASVIVLAYNSAATIRSCLNSLRAQDFKEPFEIIVVWSGDDRIPTIVKKEFPEVNIIGQSTRIFTGTARNIGISHTSGEIIAFLAADCQAQPDWLRLRVAAHREGFNCVGGAVLYNESSGLIARANHLLEYSEFMIGRPREVVVGRPVFNLSFRRNIFNKYGLYEKTLACGEDSLFNWQLAQAGERFLFDPNIRIVHAGSSTLLRLFKHQIWHGKWYARLCLNFPCHGINRSRILPFWIFIPAYPIVRIKRLLGRILLWRQDLAIDLVRLLPFLIIGIGSCTFGLIYGWLNSKTLE
jgi:glycosyltransferase involved in cell wall biosynthesis